MDSKTKILEYLSAEEYVSGQLLAEKCGISRSAVHKAVEGLRKSGYIILAVNNRGYCLKEFPDNLDEKEIRSILTNAGYPDSSVYCYSELDSTISESKRMISKLSFFRDEKDNLTEEGKKLHASLVVCGKQTAGRGRMGRIFESPENSGVYTALIYAPKNGIKNPALMTAGAAVAVARTVKELYGVECKIKWVNDVFFEGKKISGILTEGIANFETGTVTAAIVGIGINVRNQKFSPEIAKVAGCIEDIMKEKNIPVPKVSRNQIAAVLTKHLLKIYGEIFENEYSGQMPFMEEYKERNILIGKTVKVNPAAGLNGECYMAKVIDITDNAELVVQTDGKKILKLSSGEVSLKSENFCQ